jgi:membrane-anchored glycerophosphoryl diester phosphodiesterase (GDPDase)
MGLDQCLVGHLLPFIFLYFTLCFGLLFLLLSAAALTHRFTAPHFFEKHAVKRFDKEWGYNEKDSNHTC